MGLVDDAGKGLLDSMERGTLLWRVAVSGSVLVMAGYAAWSLGLIGMLGSGFAHADDVKDLKAQVADVRAVQIAEKIDAVTTTLCMTADRQLLDYRNTLQAEHFKLTGRQHESPPCEILLKLKR